MSSDISLFIFIFYALFQAALLVGHRVGSLFITRLKLYKYILNFKPNSTTSVDVFESCDGRLKDYINYAKLRHDVTDKHRFYTLKAWWQLFLCTLLISLWTFIHFFLVRDVDLVLIIILIIAFVNFSRPFNQLVILRRRLRFDPTQTILCDTRQPILFLRSFSHQAPEINLETDSFTEGGQNRIWPPLRSLEERLVAALGDIGPVVAVGKPGEPLPQLGAIRFYFDDDTWRMKVQELISSSHFVLLQPGQSRETEGLEWEMAIIREYAQPNQIIFSFMHWRRGSWSEAQTDYELFKTQFEKDYNVSLPQRIGNILFMSFDNSWTPIFSRATIMTSVNEISRGLKTLLKKNGNSQLARHISGWRIDPIAGIPVLIILLAVAGSIAAAYHKLGPYPVAQWQQAFKQPALYGLDINIPCSLPMGLNNAYTVAIGVYQNSCAYNGFVTTIEIYDHSRINLLTPFVPKSSDEILEELLDKIKANPDVSAFQYETAPFREGTLLTAKYNIKNRNKESKLFLHSNRRRTVVIRFDYDPSDTHANAATLKSLNSAKFY